MSSNRIADVIIVGSGTAGAAVADELSKAGKKVAVIERGPRITAVTVDHLDITMGHRTLRAELIQDRLRLLYDDGLLQYTDGKIALGTSALVGGPTWVIGGNGIRCGEERLAQLGIDVTQYWEEAEKDLRVQNAPEKLWGPAALRLKETSKKLGHEIRPMPKTIDIQRCTGCGYCMQGCPTGAKWNASEYVDAAEKRGALVIPDTLVTEVITENGKAVGVIGKNLVGETVEYYADAVILSAGGTRTPVILQKSGIEEAGKGLYVDTCYIAFGFTEDKRKRLEFTVPYYWPEFHETEGFLAIPLYYFHPATFVVDYDASQGKYYPDLNTNSMLEIGQKMRFHSDKMDRVLAMMVKIKDEPVGEVLPDGSVHKTVTEKDQQKLDTSLEWCKRMLTESGCDPKTIGRGMLYGGHLGGTAAIGQVVNENFETLKVKDLFVCDLSVIGGEGLGMPPILLIVAFAKHFAKRLAKEL